MHPLVAIGLVFLMGIAWVVTILTLLIALANNRRQARPEERATRSRFSDRAGV